MKRIAILFFGTMLLSVYLNAQSLLTPDDYLINGYAKKIAGLDYDYQSCIPGLRESMLLRATSGKDFIEWETEQVPAKIDKLYAVFIWVAALASSSLTANEAGLSMASLVGIKLPDEINKSIALADNALLFNTEHTLGYSESVREPLSQPTMEKRALKESYAWKANRLQMGKAVFFIYVKQMEKTLH